MIGRAPLTGADAYLVAVERMMIKAGQGQHLGLTVLELGPGFAPERFRSAVERLAAASPIAAAECRHPWLQVPQWKWDSTTEARFPVYEHAPGTCADRLCHYRLNTARKEALVFDLIPEEGGATRLLMSWRHATLDGKGAELLVAELARLAEDPQLPSHRASWIPGRTRRASWREFGREANRFKNHFNAHRRLGLRSLAGAEPRAGAAAFALERFTVEETRQIAQRAHECTRGLFMLPWFLAVAVRVHQAVFQQRGEEPESYQAGCAVQERKRGARTPIWQNQVSQLFFCLTPQQACGLPEAAEAIHAQFETLTRAQMHLAFASMTGLLRRLPRSWYLRFLRGASGGHLTSFFHSYTGHFLPEAHRLAGAPVLDGWHIPSVPGPPGSGLFFSERGGRLTATLSWRETALRTGEEALMRATLRRELLGV